MATVLCNPGPLIALGKLNRLDLLAGLFGEVQIPRAVYDEVVNKGSFAVSQTPSQYVYSGSVKGGWSLT